MPILDVVPFRVAVNGFGNRFLLLEIRRSATRSIEKDRLENRNGSG
jgi:hypothetical protein